MDAMYDSFGYLKPGYYNERSSMYMLLNLEHNRIVEQRLRTPTEAADLNYALRLTNQRWLPA